MSQLTCGDGAGDGADPYIVLLDHLRLSLDVDAAILTRREGNQDRCVAVSAEATPFTSLTGQTFPAGKPHRGSLSAKVFGASGRQLGTLVCFRHSRLVRLHLRGRKLLDAAAALLATSPWMLPDGAAQHLEPSLVAGLTTLLQPIVQLGDGLVVAAEALSRFPGDPAPSPGDVFLLAAAADLSEPLELAAIQSALATLPHVPADLRLYVNASPPVALSGRLGQMLMAAGPHRLVLELTEYDDADGATLLRALRPLREAGLQIALDDLGAGNSRLNRLVALRPDIVKLDRFLTAGIHHDPYRQAVVRSLVSMAGETGSRLIAEGIEGQQQADALHTLGLRYGQGYHLGIPVLPDRLFAANGPSWRPLAAKRRSTAIDARVRPPSGIPQPPVVVVPS